MPPFHFAAPIPSKESIRDFYLNVLGCKIGREAESWIDFDFFGHQVSFHVKPDLDMSHIDTNMVDGKEVPMRHFGAILDWDDWQALAARLKANDMDFIIEPYIRFVGEPGEQATMFFKDPGGNALEFKSFKDPSKIFAT